jgi:HlyD family secretion protein
MLNAPTPSKLWYSDVPRSARWPTILGIAVLLATVGAFGVWAGTAMIAGAVVSHGVFVATGQNKIIQHLEGGVIKEIAVREGDIVEPGQTLVLLDETTPKAELRRLVLRYVRSLAMESRLVAEARGQEQFSFPPNLLADAKKDSEIAKILESQRLTFDARKNNLKS